MAAGAGMIGFPLSAIRGAPLPRNVTPQFGKLLGLDSKQVFDRNERPQGYLLTRANPDNAALYKFTVPLDDIVHFIYLSGSQNSSTVTLGNVIHGSLTTYPTPGYNSIDPNNDFPATSAVQASMNAISGVDIFGRGPCPISFLQVQIMNAFGTWEVSIHDVYSSKSPFFASPSFRRDQVSSPSLGKFPRLVFGGSVTSPTTGESTTGMVLGAVYYPSSQDGGGLPNNDQLHWFQVIGITGGLSGPITQSTKGTAFATSTDFDNVATNTLSDSLGRPYFWGWDVGVAKDGTNDWLDHGQIHYDFTGQANPGHFEDAPQNANSAFPGVVPDENDQYSSRVFCLFKGFYASADTGAPINMATAGVAQGTVGECYLVLLQPGILYGYSTQKAFGSPPIPNRRWAGDIFKS